MKAILFLLSIIAFSSAIEFDLYVVEESYFPTSEASIIEVIMDAIKNFFDAVNFDGDLKHTCECIDKIPILIGDIIRLIESLKNVKWNDLEQIVHALNLIYDAVLEILDGIIPCMNLPKDYEPLIKKIKDNLKENFLSRIMMSITTIISSIKKAIEDIANKEYASFGKDIGDLVYLILIK